MTLTEFLLARIAEDEIWARDVGGTYYSEPYDQGAPAHHERMLADCEAKRRIVEADTEADQIAGDTGGGSFTYEAGRSDGFATALAILASVYSDHPDYREEWRP